MSSQIALILLNLLIAGTIFTHLALTTPVIFKTLDEDSAAKFLRTIFPRYYLLLFLLSLTRSFNPLFSRFILKLVARLQHLCACIIRLIRHSNYQCSKRQRLGKNIFFFSWCERLLHYCNFCS